ncbi:Acetyl-coenzyme A carboxylase carboxyl transferase subunit beta [Polystyrenella longa]|uniref:Acetyl-coenzyme A carboxylase carboxyl transferase subunit beta n=1 Tax=Polystyrenella longa TaxID=2528007 RepID=A0A518CU66_9PLAN|nr:acetyl-CoA carboxylase, carboxyltransferase subunit beta [Polystyrenella longa]QDU82748.1 Acetyl-coenzyme A carboxylase carboxyl transferase subunit beta [Polystyrenella longa]
MATSSSETSNTTDPRQQSNRPKRGVPEGLWLRCNGCQETVFRNSVEKKMGTCPECGYHFYISTDTRIQQLLDEDSFEEWFTELKSVDPLGFADRKPYPQRLEEEQKRTGLKEACTAGRGYLRGRPLVVCITDSSFIMGSMGSVVGEKLTRAIEQATELKLPLIIVSGSGGGARMHEGIFSLMQMGKVSAALARFHGAGGLYISVLTNPTMGGVAASFASLGDITIAEPKALVGFAGPRVVQATCKMELPDNFQSSEFLLEHGFVDRIVARENMRSEISRLIDYCGM